MKLDRCPVFALCYQMVLGQRVDPEGHSFESLGMSKKMLVKEKSSEPFSGTGALIN